MLKRVARWASAVVIGAGLFPGSAAAFTAISSPFDTASTLVGGFPSCTIGASTVGPIGGLDDGTNVFFTDLCNDTLYRFGDKVLTQGGSVSAPALSLANGLDSGLALSHGVYYGIAQTRSTQVMGGLYAFNPKTLVLTTKSPLVPAAEFGTGTPKAVASDPKTTDVYVSSDNGIYRVHQGGHTATLLVAGNFDGIDFNHDGTVLYAAENVGITAGHVVGFDRSGTKVLDANVGGGPDGITVAPPEKTLSGINVANNLFVNNNDGTVERIDTNNGNLVSTVASGGTRGDFAFVDSQGGLDVSQTGSFERLTPPLFGTRPTNSSLPVITGPSSTPGSRLTCSSGTWTGSPGFSYQWRNDGSSISGANNASYMIRTADTAHNLTCAVTATNAAGSTVAESNAVLVTSVPGPPVNSSSPPPKSGPGRPACTLAAHKGAIKTTAKGRKGRANSKAHTGIELTVRCSQAIKGIVVGTISLTLPGQAHKHGKRAKTRTVIVHLRDVNFRVASRVRTRFMERLSPRVLSSVAHAKSATATFLLAAANANGTAGARQTLKLVRKP